MTTFRAIDQLKPSANNARTHPPDQIAVLRRSIEEFGFVGAVLIDQTGIIAGHGRVDAAALIYADGGSIRDPNGKPFPAGKLPVQECTGWSDEQRRAYMLADNQIALLSGWNEDVLRAEIEALIDVGFAVDLTGFDEAELHRLLNKGIGATDPEEVPDEPVTPVTIPGDIWLLGDHRIICGSATDPDDVKAVLAGATPHLMVTDPPYGVDYDPNWRNEADRRNGKPYGARAVGKVDNDSRADWTEAWALFPGDVAYVWHAGEHASVVDKSLRAAGLIVRSQIIWAKQHFAIGRGDYHWQHEPCWYVVRKGAKGHYVGGHKQSTLWEIDKPSLSETGHSTQKPVECMKRPIENNSKHGDAVYEPFSGSGTTIIAGEMTGRSVFAIELSPGYVDVAVLRWQAFANRDAMLESTGQTYAEVKAERLG